MQRKVAVNVRKVKGERKGKEKMCTCLLNVSVESCVYRIILSPVQRDRRDALGGFSYRKTYLWLSSVKWLLRHSNSASTPQHRNLY